MLLLFSVVAGAEEGPKTEDLLSDGKQKGALSSMGPQMHIRVTPSAEDALLIERRLSVNLNQADIGIALVEIGEQAGAEIIAEGPLSAQVTIEFEELRLEQGLQRLLEAAGAKQSLINFSKKREDGHEKYFIHIYIRNVSLQSQKDQNLEEMTEEELEKALLTSEDSLSQLFEE